MHRISITIVFFTTFFVPLSGHSHSKLLATGGATQIEGQAGGGIVPWAVISGYGDTGEWGVAAAFTRVNVDDLQLNIASINASVDNRVEFSFSRQELDVKPLDLQIRQDIFGAKISLAGDVLYGSVPQISLGMQYKKNRDFDVPASLGADSDSGVDIYFSSTRLWLNALLGRNVLANGTLRWTEANEVGLLGFGNAKGKGYSMQIETSVGLFISRHWVVGVEYRQMPNNLDGVREQDWWDAFVGWFPNKYVAVVAAYSDLGNVAGLPDQSGLYLSLQLTP
tara:strand:+ start:3337 stop:4176 length:840 start_codon:yes stop_codon:yes gene_type:complete